MTTVYEAQGSVFTAREMRAVPLQQRGGGTRGKITGFSNASRRRLIRLFARMDARKVRTTFLTLTFSSAPAPEDAKRALKRFTMRLRRRYHALSGVWRMEYQSRGAIHFHLILFNLPYIPQKQLQQWWEACTHEARSIVDVRLVHNRRVLMSYVSKYVAKRDSAPAAPAAPAVERFEPTSSARTMAIQARVASALPPARRAGAVTSLEYGTYQHAESTGRFYGVINAELLPFAPLARAYCEDAELERYSRWCMRSISRGRSGHTNSPTLYTEDAYRMLDYIVDKLPPAFWIEPDTWYQAVNRYAMGSLYDTLNDIYRNRW